MKKLIAIISLAVLLLAGCAGEAPAATVPTTEPAAEIYCPWQYDVVSHAMEQGTLDYYFMSSEGAIAGEEQFPGKWGDCCLIVFPNGQTMLMDCGVTEFGPILTENLRRMGIKRLDHIVITHPHSDHQNGIFHPDNLTGEGVLDQFEIGHIYHRGGTDPNREDDLYVETVCKERGLKLQVLEMENTIALGEVTARVLWPKPGTSHRQITGTANVNNSSIVIRFDYKEHSALFTGDLYDDGEMALLSSQDTAIFDVDLLKAPHHGGYTSGCEMFLGIVSAELAVATGYETIRDDAAGRYENCQTPLLDDRTYGYIHVTTDGDVLRWESSRTPEDA